MTNRIFIRRVILLNGSILFVVFIAIIYESGLRFDGFDDMFDFDPHPQASSSIAESRSRGNYLAPVTIQPGSISIQGCHVEFNEAWIEDAVLRKPLFPSVSYCERAGYRILCFTIKNGKDNKCFVGTDHPFFVLNDGGKSFSSINRSELFYEQLSSVEPGERKIYLLSSWQAPRNVFVTAKIE